MLSLSPPPVHHFCLSSKSFLFLPSVETDPSSWLRQLSPFLPPLYLPHKLIRLLWEERRKVELSGTGPGLGGTKDQFSQFLELNAGGGGAQKTFVAIKVVNIVICFYSFFDFYLNDVNQKVSVYVLRQKSRALNWPVLTESFALDWFAVQVRQFFFFSQFHKIFPPVLTFLNLQILFWHLFFWWVAIEAADDA